MNLRLTIKYIILALFVLNLPTFGLVELGGAVGGVLSYLSYALLIGYYIFFLKGKVNLILLYCGIIYFTFSSFQIFGDERLFLTTFAKFLILVIFGSSFFKEVSKKEIAIILTIAALSILVNSVVGDNFRGRSVGFFVNPNAAGFVAMFGYAYTYSLKNKKWKAGLQVLFSLAGFLTFSRTFILVWILINLFSIKISAKNIKILAIGASLFIGLLIVGEAFNIGGERFEKYKGVLDSKTTTRDLNEDSRTTTWALFYDEVMKKPIFGGGYGYFQGGGIRGVGAHNTYLLIIGEAGIFAFILFLGFNLFMVIKSWSLFHLDPSLFMMSFTLSIYLLTTHNYFDNAVKLSLTMYLLNKILYQDQLKKQLLISNV